MVTFDTYLSHNYDTVYRCLGDTLDLMVEHNPDSVPVEWIYDGKNPVFLPIFSYPDEIEEYRMEIYNRWGVLVFRTEELTFGWDGSNAMGGVYAVVVHYKTRGEKAKTVTGSVTVMR